MMVGRSWITTYLDSGRADIREQREAFRQTAE
jgi:hypothetical protein